MKIIIESDDNVGTFGPGTYTFQCTGMELTNLGTAFGPLSELRLLRVREPHYELTIRGLLSSLRPLIVESAQPFLGTQPPGATPCEEDV